MGAVEAISSDGVPTQDVVLADLLDEALVCSDDVGAQAFDLPVELTDESFFEGAIADACRIRVEVDHTIEADGVLGCNVGADRSLVLQSARGADTYEGELTEGVLLLAGLEVDVRQGIQLIEDDVDIVRADAVADDGDALALVRACDGVELAARYIALDGVEA